jgi:hypothetical protein
MTERSEQQTRLDEMLGTTPRGSWSAPVDPYNTPHGWVPYVNPNNTQWKALFDSIQRLEERIQILEARVNT